MAPRFALRANALYPLRIIGLNQDQKATGGMAGLTFVFVKMMTNRPLPTNAPWHANASRTYLNEGDGWAKLPASVQGAVAPVVKRSNLTGDMYWASTTWGDTTDRLFLTSTTETKVGREAVVTANKAGVGRDRTEHYLCVDFPAACKGLDAAVAAHGGGWGWGRDYNQLSNQVYLQGFGGNGLGWFNPASHPEIGYFPSFCL